MNVLSGRKDAGARRAGDEPSAGEAAAEHERWLAESYGPDVARRPERKRFRTDCGIDVAPLYSPRDLAGFDPARDLGFPGEFPFTRGDRPAMYRNEAFVVSAYTGFGEAEACNRRLKHLLGLGVEQLLLAFDLPTQCGYDADHIMSTGEVGRVGVAISSLADMEALFDGIPLDSVKRVGTLGNSIGPIVLAMFAALGEKQGLRWSDYTVNLQNDVLKEYLARGTQILPPRPAARLAVDPVEWCVDHAPHWSPMTVCCNHLNAAGAGSSAATALALANAVHYIDLLLARGRTIDQVAPLLHMFPDERHDFFVQIANLRALRRFWAKLMKERYGATLPAAMALRTTVYGHGQETLQEPLNNVARIGYGTLGYVLGGASYVYIASWDEAIGTPSEEAVRVAVRTQEIIAHEHGFTDTIDPLGGSYFVESLTNQVEAQIAETFAAVLQAGGALAAIEGGFGRRLMNEGATRRQRDIESGERPWVTVNLWPQKPTGDRPAFRADKETAARQQARLDRVRRERDPARVAAALAAVEAAGRDGGNVVEPVLEAVRAYATVGEICDIWRRQHGVFEPSRAY
ncbi:MAG: methylmalonyl-CoA mutase family protein [Dongiaceae bacterium]